MSYKSKKYKVECYRYDGDFGVIISVFGGVIVFVLNWILRGN